MRFKTFLLVIYVMFQALSSLAQMTSDSELENFNAIQVKYCNCTIELLPGTRNYMYVESVSFRADKVFTSFFDDIMVFNFNPPVTPQDEIKIFITYTNLESIDLEGPSIIKTNGTIKTRNLELQFTGQVQADLEIDVESLDVFTNHGVMVKLKGNAHKQSLELKGSSKYRAFNLSSEFIDLKASEGSTLELHATQTIQGETIYGVNVYYMGDPETLQVQSKYGGALIRVE